MNGRSGTRLVRRRAAMWRRILLLLLFLLGRDSLAARSLRHRDGAIGRRLRWHLHHRRGGEQGAARQQK